MKILLSNPFEQFMINNNYVFISNLLSVKYFVNNISIILVLIILILMFINIILKLEKKYFNINIILEIIKIIYIFIHQNVTKNLSLKASNLYFSFYFFLFLFIMLSNIIGILPYSFAITSHFIITFFLSFVVCYSNLLIGFKVNSLNFFEILYAKGVPFILIPFLIVIETISYLFRSISLALRLFANLVAGHILLDTLNLFIFKLISIKTITINNFLFTLIPIFFSIILLLFEIFVAILQAYIFVILSLIFSKDTYNTKH